MRGLRFVYDLSQSCGGSAGCPGGDRRGRGGVWSPLEYGCDLRDMLLVQRERVLAARRMNRPECSPMGRDERVVHDGCAEQEPEDVARQLRGRGTAVRQCPNPTGPRSTTSS